MIDIQTDNTLAVLGARLRDPENIVAADLLKTASIDTDFSDLVDDAFADKENRRFPIFSPEYAAMSALYMQVQEVDPLVKEACDKALRDWGIEGISTDMKIEKDAINVPEDRFLVPSRMKFPVVDEETLEKSASALKGVFHTLELPEKLKAAEKLYKFATMEYGVDPEELDEDILRYALKVPCDLNKLASAVSERYAETHFDKYKDFIEKVASLKDDIGGSISFDESLNNGIGLELYRIDQEAGVANEFDAIYDVFNSPYVKDEGLGKVAANTVKTVVIGGVEVEESQLMKLSSADIDHVAPGFSEQIFTGDSIDMDKLHSTLNNMSTFAAAELGKIISSL
jgi:hypothetical protein